MQLENLESKLYRLKKFVSAIAIACMSRQYFFQIIKLIKYSKSQFNQDLYVISLFYRKGIELNKLFFVEFGAADGILHSNTYLIENFGANGILAEPCKSFHEALAINRKSIVDKRCVYHVSGDTVLFEEMKSKQLSKIGNVEDSRLKTHTQERMHTYNVTTVSLIDLLTEHSAPLMINYLSIDTEGAELKILQGFDFFSFKFDFISVEHNYRSDRKEIHDLISSHGYKRVHNNLSRFEYWYLRSDFFQKSMNFGD